MKEGALKVERAGPDDIPQLVELMNQFYAESDYVLDRPWAEGSFRELFAREERGRAWIARLGGQPAGHVVLTLRHSMEFGAQVGFIDDLFVAPGSRRKGVGSALLTTLFSACRDLRAAAVHVEAGSSNAAASGLYSAFGLVPYSDDRRTLTARLAVYNSTP